MRTFIWLGLVSCFVCVNAFAQINFTDNFDDGNIDGWNVIDTIAFATGEPHAEVTFPDGTLRLNSPATPNPAFGTSALAIEQPDFVFTDFEMSVDVVENNSSVDGFVGIAGRSVGPFVGYSFSYGQVDGEIFPASNLISIARGDPGAPPTVLEEIFIDDLPRDNVKLVFRGKGDTLSGEIFSLDDLVTPLASLTVQDNTYGQGINGIFVFGASPPPPNPPNLASFGNARFDNYTLVAQVPEPSGGLLLVIGVVGCGLSRRNQRGV